MARFVTAVLLAGLAALPGCDSDSETATPSAAGPDARLTGTVTYRERMALPPGSTIEVRLEDVSRADAPAMVLGEQVLTIDREQVPIAFGLDYESSLIEPRRRIVVRAVIRDPQGGMLFTTTQSQPAFDDDGPIDPLEIVVQRVASRDDGTPQSAAGEAATARAFVFDCGDGFVFTVRSGTGEVSLLMPAALGGRTVALPATPAASGARYEADGVLYWNQGEEATIEVDGRRFAGCRLTPATEL